MVAGRVAAGLTLALLLVGAVVHYRPARQVSSAFVSAAALNVDKLAKCTESPQVWNAAGDAAAGAGNAADGNPTANIPTDLLVNTAPCACGKSVCTAGRVCQKATTEDGEDACYLPRCRNDGATKVGDKYTAGCVCAADNIFVSSDPLSATVGLLETCDAGKKSKSDLCKCGTGQACKKGEICAAEDAAGTCNGVADATTAVAVSMEQTTVYAKPADLTDATKFAICKNTNSGGDQACDYLTKPDEAPKCAEPTR